MKKEFNAPTIEAKKLPALDSVMSDVMVLSAGYTQTKALFTDENVTDGFKQWKGLGE